MKQQNLHLLRWNSLRTLSMKKRCRQVMETEDIGRIHVIFSYLVLAMLLVSVIFGGFRSFASNMAEAAFWYILVLRIIDASLTLSFFKDTLHTYAFWRWTAHLFS